MPLHPKDYWPEDLLPSAWGEGLHYLPFITERGDRVIAAVANQPPRVVAARVIMRGDETHEPDIHRELWDAIDKAHREPAPVPTRAGSLAELLLALIEVAA